MKNSFKKLTAWLCCMALLISFIPATALPVFAEAAELPSSGTLNAGEYVLNESATLSSVLTVSSGDVTVDLNGNTLTGKAAGAFKVTGGKLTVKNGDVQGVASNATAALVTVEDGEFVLENGTLSDHKTKSTARLPGGIYATGGTVTINGGSVTGTNGASSTLLKRTGHSLYAENATVNVNGGTINGGDYHVVLGVNGKLNVTGAAKLDTVYLYPDNATGAAVAIKELASGASIKLNGITPTTDDSVEQNNGAYVYTAPAAKFDITKTAAENGSYTVTVGGTAVEQAAEGDVVTITATADAGYLVDEILVNDEAIDGTTFTMPAEAVTVKVTFKEDTTVYTVSVGAVSNGTVVVDPTEGTYGTTVSVTATPADGYELKKILVDGEAIDGTTFTITDNHTVTAEFIDPNAKTPLTQQSGVLAAGSYILEDDLTLTGWLTVRDEVVIDLAGHTITAGEGGHAFLLDKEASNLTIMDSVSGGKVQSGASTGNPAIFLQGAGAQFTLDGGEITGWNREGGAGGMVYLQAGTSFTMNGGKLTGASCAGNAIIRTGAGESTITINGGEISGNSVTGNAPIGLLSGVTMNITDGVFTGNTAGGYGLIHVGAGATLNISGGEFTENTANNGGVIYNEGTVAITDGTFTDNTGTTAGGAIQILKGSTTTITGGTFTGNSSARGGAIGTGENVVTENLPVLTIGGDVVIEENICTEYGGNLYLYTPVLTINGGTIGTAFKGEDVVGKSASGNNWVRGNAATSVTITGGDISGLTVSNAATAISGNPIIGEINATMTMSNLTSGAKIHTAGVGMVTVAEGDETVYTENDRDYTYLYRPHAVTVNYDATMGTASASVTEAKCGDEVTVTAAPSAVEYVLKSITVTKTGDEDTVVEVNGGKFKMPDYAVTVTVEFAQLDDTQTIVTLIQPAEGGSVDVDVDTDTILAAGTVVTVSAEAESGYDIVVTVDGEEVELTDGQYTFTTEGTKVHAVKAETQLVDYTVTLEYGEANVEGGTVTLDKTSANYGETITITVAAGYDLISVLVNGEAIEGNTFTMPAEDVTVTVVTAPYQIPGFENLNGVTSGTLPEGKYTLTGDVELTGALIIRATAIIDLAGNTISLSDETAGCCIFNIPAGGKLTIMDSVGGGKVVFKEMVSSGGISLSGTFVLEGGELTGWSRRGAGGFIDMFANSTFKMTGGKITGISAASDTVIRSHSAGVTVDIMGGEIVGNECTNGSILGVGKAGGQNWLNIGGTAVIKDNTMGGNATPFNYDQIKTVDAIVTIGDTAFVAANFQATLGSLTALENSQLHITGAPYIKYLRADSSAKTLVTITELEEGAEIHTSYTFVVAEENKDASVAVEAWNAESGNANEAGNIYTFNYPIHAITLNVNDDTMGEAAVSMTEAKKGNEVTVTATPYTGYAVTNIVVKNAEGEDVPLMGDKFTMPNSPVTVTVEFAALNETQSFVNLTQPETEGGSVDIDVPVGEIIEAGTQVTITATAETGYEIIVTVDGEKVELTDGQYIFNAEGTKVHTVKAETKLIDYTVTLEYGEGNVEGGTVTLDKTTANYGETITITVAEGYDLISVLVNGEAIEGNTFAVPAEDVTVTVVTAVHVIPEYEGLNGVTGGTLPEGIYTLTENVTLASILLVKSDVTIDLAGYSITAEAGGGIIRVFDANAKLTVKDSVGGGKLVSGANEGIPAIDVQAGCFTLDGGEITGWSRPGAGGAIFLAANTTFIMNGGKIAGNIANDRAAVRADNGGHTVIINGGEISGNVSNTEAAVVRIIGGTTKNGVTYDPSTVTITGGKITGNTTLNGYAAVQMDTCNLTISGNPVIESLAFTGASNATIGDLTEGASVTAAKANTLQVKAGDRTAYTEDGLTYIYAPTYVVAVNNLAIENGEVNLSLKADDAFNADISLLAPADKKIYFYGTAEVGYRLKSVSLVDAEGEAIETEINMAEGWFIMPAAEATIAAEFEAIPTGETIVRAETAVNGVMNVTPVGTVAANTVITIVVEADLGYRVTRVTVNGDTIGKDNGTYTFTAEGGKDYTVAAEFTRTVYSVTADVSVGNRASASVATAKIGDTFTIKAGLDYTLVDAYVYYLDENGDEVEILPAEGTYTYTMPAADVFFTVETAEAGTIPVGGVLPTSGAVAEGTYTLTSKHTLTGTLIINGRVVIDLAGRTLQMGKNMTTGAFSVKGRLTIKDSVGGGKVRFQAMNSSGGIAIQAGGEFALESGTLTGWSRRDADGVYGAGGFIDMFSNSTFRMTGGKITNIGASGQTVIRCHEAAVGGHTVEITGGEITGNNAVSGDIIRVEGAATNMATLVIGGNAKISGNTYGGEAYTASNYEIMTKNTVVTVEGEPTIGMLRADSGSTLAISGTPVIEMVSTTSDCVNSISDLQPEASITAKNELTIAEGDSSVMMKEKNGYFVYTFNYPPQEITTNVIGGEMGSVEVVEQGQKGDEIVVTATPATIEYVVKRITVTKTGDEATIIPVVGNKFTMPNYPVTVTVEFAQLNDTQTIVNLTQPETEGGSVDISVATGEIIGAGTPVTVYTHPATGYAITLFVDGEEVELIGGQYIFTTEGTVVYNIVAIAEKVDYTIDLEYGEDNAEGGTVTLDKTTANYGETITVTVEEDFVLVSVLVNGEAIEGNTFTMPAANVTVTVVTAPYQIPEFENLNGVTSGTLPEGKYILTGDVELTGTLIVRENVIIDLAGNTISLSDETAGCGIFNIHAGGKLTIMDSVGGGKVEFVEMAASGGISLTGTFVLEGGELTGWSRVEDGVLKAGGFIDMFANATFKMTGGKIAGISAASDTVIRSHGAGVTVDIMGGEIVGNECTNGGILGVGKAGGQSWLNIGGTAVIKDNTMGGNAAPFNYDQIKTVDTIVTIGDTAFVEANVQATLGSLTALEGSQINITGAPYVKYLRADSSAKTLITITELEENAEIHTSYQFTVAAENMDSTVAVKEWNAESGNANEAGKIYVFNYPIHAITLNVNGDAMGEATVSMTEAQKGDVITVTATANSGYALKSITVKDAEGQDVAVVDGKFTMPNCAVTVTVEFAQLNDQQTIVMLTRPTEGGSVDVDVVAGDIIEAGTQVTITATAEAGYEIIVTVDGEEVELTDGQYTFTTEGGKVHTVKAETKLIDYTVALEYGEENVEGGTATLDKAIANVGDTVTVTVAAGYDLISVLVNGEAIEGNTFTMPAEDVTVTVVTAVHVIPEYEGLNGVTGGTLPEGIYTLTENVTLTSMLVVKSDVTIDLAGYSITAEAGGGIIRVFDANAKLTVKDSVGGGKLVSGASEGTPAIDVQAGCFTLDGGEITGWSRAGAGGAIFMAANTTFIMNGGKITGNTANDRAAVRADNGGHTVIINGGEISGNVSNTEAAVVRITGGATDKAGVTYDPSTVIITGGKITGNTTLNGYAAIQIDTSAVTISGNPVIESVAFTGASTATIGELTEGASVTAAKANALTLLEGDRTAYTEDGLTYIYALTYMVEVDNNAFKNGEVTMSLVKDDEFNADISVLAPADKKVYFYAATEAGYYLKSLSLADAEGNAIETEVNLAEGWFIMPAIDAVVTAEFEAISTAEAVVKAATAVNGSLIVNPVGTVAANAVITVVAKANMGYRVDKITVNDEIIGTAEGSYTFTVEGGKDYTVVAEFTRNAYSITADASVEGRASASAATAKMGDTFTINAGLDYKLTKVTVTYKDVDGTEVELVANEDGSYTMPAADVVFSVETVEADPIPEGGVLPTSGAVAEGIYTLSGKHTLTGTLIINGRVVIDLAGRTLQMGKDMTTGAFNIKGRLTIKDSVGGGKVQFKTMSASGGITIMSSGEFVLEGGELTGWNRKNVDGVYQSGGFIDMFSNATFRMTGGKITNIGASGQTVIRCHEATIGGHTVEITGGEITGNSAVTGDIIRMEGAADNRATLTIGGDAKIGDNRFDGEDYTYANYEIQGTNTDFIITGGTIGVIAPGVGSTMKISGAPVIDALRAALNNDGSLKEATSIALGELTDGALIITGGGLDLSKVTTIPEGIASAYWNNQDELGTQYQGYVYFPSFAVEYNQPVSNDLLPAGLTWAVEGEEAKFDTVGEAVYQLAVNGTTADLTVNVLPQTIDLTQVVVKNQYYTGEQIKPALELTDNYGNKIPAEQIVVTYGENVKLGEGTISVTDETGNYAFQGEVTFQIVKGKTDLGYPTGSMMVAIKPNTATTANAVALTVPAQAGAANVIIGDVTGEADFVKNISYANGTITFDTEAMPFGTVAQFTVTVKTANYEDAQLVVEVKAFEKVLPTGLKATYGYTLADISLADFDGWRWADPTQSVGNVGVNTFKMYFSNESATTDVKVTVEPKTIAIIYKLTNDTTPIIFNNTAKKPAVTVTVKGEGVELDASQYEIEYADNINAGTATYTIKAGSNYSFADAIGTFVIKQAKMKNLTAQNRGVSAQNSATVTVNMGNMLPADRDNANETTYDWGITSGANAIKSVEIEDGVVTIVTNALKKAATAKILVTATSDNYLPVTLTITVELKAAVSGGGDLVGGGGGFGGGPSDDEKPEDDKPAVESDEYGNEVTTTTDKYGNSTTVVKGANGVTATTTSDLYGRYTTNVVIPASAVVGSEPVLLPVQGKGQANVTVPGTVKVEYPVEKVTPGTIAVIVNADGTETLVKDAKQSEKGMILTLTENCTVKVYDNSKSFNDMAGHWSNNAVAFVTARGMFAGTGNGTTFSPEVKMTRAMLAQVIYNLEGAEEHSHDANFADVAADAWYSKAINWAAREGIVSGYSNGTYQPDKALTREEVVQIFYNYAKSKGYDMSHSADLSTFADGHDVSDWAMTAKQWGVGAGLISGKGGNILDAKGGATRAEGAQMFMNFCQNIAQ